MTTAHQRPQHNDLDPPGLASRSLASCDGRCNQSLVVLVALVALLASCLSPRNAENSAEDIDSAGTSSGTDGGSTVLLYHSAGYLEGPDHGLETNLQADDCQQCHGQDLRGGTSGVGCDAVGCHTEDWRTDCLYCHGGETPGGAPPRDIDGTTDRLLIAFPAHTAHVTEQGHPAFECIECHALATDILTPGHAFDDTPGRAEVQFVAGLSSAGTYDGSTGSCSNLYCHGTGTQPGSATLLDGKRDCSSCHPDARSAPAAWAAMSGEHARHLRDQVACGDCHSAVVSGNDTIVNASLHVNGIADPTMTGTGITYSNGSCTGFCHSKGHFYDAW